MESAFSNEGDMRVRDPVCGMWLDTEQSVAAAHYDGVIRYFCAERCHQTFEMEPQRFLDGEDNNPRFARTSVSGAVPTTCPFCQTETGISRGIAPELSSLSLDEFETLVRNEWRRRIGKRNGKSAYHRLHPRQFIRALIVYAVKPESPVRSTVVDELLWKEVSELAAWGFSRRRIQGELLRLSQAIWEVLSRTDLELDRDCTLMERIDKKILAVLSWPDRP